MAGTDTRRRSTPAPSPRYRRPPGRRRRLAGAAAVAVTAIVVLVVALRPGPAAPPPPACTVTAPAGAAPYRFAPDQIQNAAVISAVAYRHGLPDHAVTVALATALQESGLRDLQYGDRDSVGLFQQRPSQGWGTRDQLLDPVYATTAFYAALQKVPGWLTMTVTDAAQAVQLSAVPSAYAGWEDQARALAVALTGESPSALACRMASYSGAVPPAGALGAAMREEMGSDLIGATLGAKTGWMVASWVVAHAYAYHVGAVAFDGWGWQHRSGRWQRISPAAATVQVVPAP